MSKRKFTAQGQMPLIASVSPIELNKQADKIVKQKIPAMPVGSPKEYTFFKNAFLTDLTNDQRSSKSVDKAISAMFKAGHASTKSLQALAIALNDYSVLTGLKLDVISKRFSDGMQTQWSRGHVSKLCTMGQVLSTNPIASKITDLEKIVYLGKYSSEEIARVLTEVDGIVYIGPIAAVHTNRADFKSEVDKFFGVVETAPKWSPASFLVSLEAALKATKDDSDKQLYNILNSAVAPLQKRIASTKKTTLKVA